MSEIFIEIPGFLPTPLDGPPAQLEDLALHLYQRVADGDARAEACEQKAREQIEETAKRSNRIITELACERFEFERLMKRILPDLENAGLESTVKVVTLYARSWDSNLKRAQIEVIDLAGNPLTDEIAEVIEVESSIPDPSVRAVMIRETLSPLVRVQGRVTGLARVITSVPVQENEEPESAEGELS